MNYLTLKLISPSETTLFQEKLLSCSDWVDGQKTAIGQVKRNLQISQHSNTYKELSQKITNILLNQAGALDLHVFPEKIIGILFSRTATGMFYGAHLDAPYVEAGRRDYSFTLFLNSPEDYEGGELILSMPPERRTIKLRPGEMIIYSTKYLHEVKEVTKGERLVCVGWIQSIIKDDMGREILADLATAKLNLAKEQHENASLALNVTMNKLLKYFGK